MLSTHHSRVWLDMAIRKLLVVLLTVSPYRHLVYYTTGMANFKIQNVVSTGVHLTFVKFSYVIQKENVI